MHGSALLVEMQNPQYEYDHRQDQALFMDSDYVQRKLRSMQNAYEKYKDLLQFMADRHVLRLLEKNHLLLFLQKVRGL